MVNVVKNRRWKKKINVPQEVTVSPILYLGLSFYFI